MKRKKYATGFLALLFVAAGATQAGAVTIKLYESAFYLDGGATSTTGSLTNGLGTLHATITGAGPHSFTAFFDHDIDSSINTYFNEYGSVVGSPAHGQSWEIDEPGYVYGDIKTHAQNGALDNTNEVPASAPDDVSMAMGWKFNLDPGQTATITLLLGDSAPSGFYLAQTDTDYNQPSIYFSSGMSITGGGGGNPVPEPCTMLLMGSGLAGLLGMGRKMRRQS